MTVTELNPNEVKKELDQAAQEKFEYAARAKEVKSFIDEIPTEYDWLVPGLIERGERFILTGPEGKSGGKSTLLRQWAVQFSSGIHPFGGTEFPPLKVLYLDLENSPRLVSRKMRELLGLAGDKYIGGLDFACFEGGLSINDHGAEIIRAEMAKAQCDVLIIGPIYKMLDDEESAAENKALAYCLDAVRSEFNCSIFIEAHVPHEIGGKKERPIRPIGWSGWRRWPDFGYYIDATGSFESWKTRDEREWPSAMKRNGDWPWTADPMSMDGFENAPSENSRNLTDKIKEEYFIQLINVRSGRPHLSQTEIADKYGCSQKTVSTVFNKNSLRWPPTKIAGVK